MSPGQLRGWPTAQVRAAPPRGASRGGVLANSGCRQPDVVLSTAGAVTAFDG